MEYISEIKGRSGKDHIDSVMKRVGPLRSITPVSEDDVSKYLGILPDILIDFWRHHGLGTLQNGLMTLCLPSEFDGLLSQIFHADKDFSHQDCYVIGYGPFGDLVIWSERYWLANCSLLHGRLDCRGLIYPEKKKNWNTPIVSGLLGHGAETLNAYDDDGKPLYARARKKLGPLEQGECYGFFPALAMGGAPDLKNLKRVKALEHFIFLAQLQQFSLIDYLARPIKEVRKIG